MIHATAAITTAFSTAVAKDIYVSTEETITVRTVTLTASRQCLVGRSRRSQNGPRKAVTIFMTATVAK